MASKLLPDIAVLRQLLTCDHQTGQLFWLPRPREMFHSDRTWKMWNTRYAFTEAFTTINAGGYRVSAIWDEKFYGHRVVFAMLNGRWPEGEVDHVDGNRANNRPDNLREVSSADNKRNTALKSTNQSGAHGISRHSNGRWRAVISNRHIGYYSSFEEACAAKRTAEIELGYHPNHGRRS